jgi:hypothetical protein
MCAFVGVIIVYPFLLGVNACAVQLCLRNMLSDMGHPDLWLIHWHNFAMKRTCSNPNIIAAYNFDICKYNIDFFRNHDII